MEIKTLHPLPIIGIFTVIVLSIHPIQDGNRRLSHILTTLLLLQSNYLYSAYSSLNSMIEHNKEGYYLALHRTQGTLKKSDCHCGPWLMFFLKALQKQKIHLWKRCPTKKTSLSIFPSWLLSSSSDRRRWPTGY
jgi:Fic family protein